MAAVRGCIQKFPDWPPGARTANFTALCHWVQLYRYFVSQYSEFCRYNPLCCFPTSVCCCCLFRYQLSPETFGYTLVQPSVRSWRRKIRHVVIKAASVTVNDVGAYTSLIIPLTTLLQLRTLSEFDCE
jgi:hypothetical protein